MRDVLSTLIIGAIALCPSVLSAQKPDFSGVWLIDWVKTDAANAELGGSEPHGANVRWTVTQDAKTLTLLQPPARARSYNLDGTESRNPIGPNGATIQIATATWQGSRLRIVIKGAAGDTTNEWTLDHGALRITTTWPKVNGAAVPRTALVFTRAS